MTHRRIVTLIGVMLLIQVGCNKFIKVFEDDNDSPFSYDYKFYQPFHKIANELYRLSDTSRRHSVFSIGKTFEKRKLYAFKIDNTADKDDRKTIVIDCGAHAREWIAPSTCMYLLKKLTDNSKKDKRIGKLRKRYDFVIIPVLNPDGYVHTWKGNATRLWRKNRSFTKDQMKIFLKTKNPLCIGVDVNRNFDKAWGGPGAPVNNPCFEMFAGAHAFSEKESQALAKYLNSTRDDVISYVSLHNFGQVWTTPWGFTKKEPAVYDELKRVASLATKSMKKMFGVNYTVGTSHDEIYPNSGSSTDWAYSKLSIKYPYLIEMRPKTARDRKSVV